MKDESAHLLAEPTTAVAAPARPAAAPTIVHLPLYRHGTRVVYQGQFCTVSHVVISRGLLMVHLQETGSAVDAEKLQLAPTRLELKRA